METQVMSTKSTDEAGVWDEHEDTFGKEHLQILGVVQRFDGKTLEELEEHRKGVIARNQKLIEDIEEHLSTLSEVELAQKTNCDRTVERYFTDLIGESEFLEEQIDVTYHTEEGETDAEKVENIIFEYTSAC